MNLIAPSTSATASMTSASVMTMIVTVEKWMTVLLVIITLKIII